jgi:DNA-binding NarL/FixJ family response regulator
VAHLSSEQPQAISVGLVDDDPLVRRALRLLLAGAEGIEVVAEAGDGDEVPVLVREHRPDVLLVDVRMPVVDGIEAVRRLATDDDGHRPAALVLTTFESDASVLEAVRAGAVGFLLKHSPPDRIVDAVRAAAAGEPAFSPSALRALVEHVGTSSAATGPAPAIDPATLSDRELAVARAVARGLTNAEIAAELYVSSGTVKADVSALLTRLGMANRTQLAIAAHSLPA